MSKVRLLKNSRHEVKYLGNNELYTFSLKHSMSIYCLDAIYSFIPKNACSSLRFSIALANGFVKSIDDIRWIHKNNQTFMPSKRDLALAKFTFIILRCPFTRVASSFLNKIVDGKLNFNDREGRLLKVSFNEFLKIIKSQKRSERDEHWRNQSDFLHYDDYDEYYCVEALDEAIASLYEKGLQVIDTRDLLNHDLSKFERFDGDFPNTKQDKIKLIKDNGRVPSYKSLFSKTEIALVKDIYSDDIDLYKSKFGDKNLLFK
jgi:hypothetical protein